MKRLVARWRRRFLLKRAEVQELAAAAAWRNGEEEVARILMKRADRTRREA